MVPTKSLRMVAMRNDLQICWMLDIRGLRKQKQRTDCLSPEHQLERSEKEIYDRKHHQPEVFSIGAIVLKDFTRKKRKGGKLDTKWTGPYKVAKAHGRGL